jgi:osmotically-inducible protein OsmY
MKTQLLMLTLALGIPVLHAATTMEKKVVAQDQALTKTADVEITRKIRDRLTNTEGLSTKAQNITILTNDWGITLQGEVDKQSEISTITNIAQEYAGSRAVRNQLKVVK